MTPIPPIPEDRLEQLANDPMMCNISPEVKLCLQELIEARQRIAKLTAEVSLLSQAPLCAGHADAWYCSRNHIKSESGCIWCDIETENTCLKAALTKPIETHEAVLEGYPECEDPDLVKAIERIYASRATRTPPQEGQ